jgi:hypothetical protein
VTSFDASGMLTFRTRLMELEPAARFAKCIAANPRFGAVEIVTSRRAKGERRFYVTYLPTNEARLAAIVDRQQSARAKRATEQDFVFCHDGDHDFFHCHSISSGEVYETTLNSCTCPDHTWRCLPNQIACKHSLALADHLREERTTTFKPVTPSTHRADQDRFDMIFSDRDQDWLR